MIFSDFMKTVKCSGMFCNIFFNRGNNVINTAICVIALFEAIFRHLVYKNLLFYASFRSYF